MARDLSIKKVLVIGSGPIIIGQAAEFDYAGTQACRALREEGVEVVLINSNPATIMTDADIADKVYIEPLTVPVVKKLIPEQKPDSIFVQNHYRVRISYNWLRIYRNRDRHHKAVIFNCRFPDSIIFFNGHFNVF